jgi:hypothetical protein
MTAVPPAVKRPVAIALKTTCELLVETLISEKCSVLVLAAAEVAIPSAAAPAATERARRR